MKASIKEEIKKRILEFGFDLIGFTDTQIPEHIKKTYIYWIENNYFGDMNYMKQTMDKRLDINKVWKNAKVLL